MSVPAEKYLLIPVSCIQIILAGIAVFGLGFGLLAFIKPEAPLRMYQWMMRKIHWRVEPEDEALEIRATRIMGALMIPLSLAIFFLVQRW